MYDSPVGGRISGKTHFILATEADTEIVLRWFRERPAAPDFVEHPRGWTLYFRTLGPLVRMPDEPQKIDVSRSPVVNIFAPRRRRGVLLTAMEVHFLTTLSHFPAMGAINRAFHRWLGQAERVYSAKPSAALSDWDYYLEGSIRNFAEEVFALPSAMEALRKGQYFVTDRESDVLIDKLCKSLRLRGVEGITD